MICQTQSLCYDVEGYSHVIKESTRRFLHTSDILWLLSELYVGLGTPSPSLLATRDSIFINLLDILSIPSIVDRKLIAKASSNEPMYYPTPGTVHMRYCNSAWSEINISAYAVCRYLTANPQRVFMVSSHPWNLGRIHCSISSGQPQNPPNH